MRTMTRIFGLFAVATLGVTLASCSASGGSSHTTPLPTASPSATPGPIVFTGSSITNNVMALPCDTPETFTVSEANYSGTFQLVPSKPELSITPTSVTASTTFTALEFEDGTTQTYTVIATGAVAGTLTVNFTPGQQCG